MARAFTIDFHYKEKTYPAFVSISNMEGMYLVQVNLLNETLNPVLPSQTVKYAHVNGKKIYNTEEQPQAKELMECIADAVDTYLLTTG